MPCGIIPGVGADRLVADNMPVDLYGFRDSLHNSLGHDSTSWLGSGVGLHRDAGVLCNVVPRSGAAAGFKGDIRIHLLDGDPLDGEVKSRTSGSGFATLQRWLGEHDLLIVKQDREPALVVLPWSTWRRICQTARRRCGRARQEPDQ